MAEFGIGATSLSAPQGAGASVLTPVAEQPVNTGISNTQMQVLGGLLTDGIKQQVKDEAQAKQNSIVGSYIKNEGMYNDAVTSGQMSPAQAAIRSRANSQMFFAQYPEYVDKLTEAAKALRLTTQTGENFNAVEDAKKAADADVSFAKTRGFQFTLGMSEQTKQDQVNAAYAGFNAERALEARNKANAEARTQGTFDQGIADRQAKDQSVTLINDIAGANLTAFQSFSKTLGDNVRNGSMKPEEAQIQLSERFSNIMGGITSAARVNLELATPYRTLFSEMNEVGKKLIDPKNAAEDMDNQLKVIQNKLKIVAMSNPKIAATVVANQLLPNNATLALSSATAGVEAITVMSANPVDTKNLSIPNVVGNPELEKPTMDLLKGGLQSIKDKTVRDPLIAEVQAGNTVNHVLKQVGKLINEGQLSATDLKGTADFLASPEFASFATNKNIDKGAANAAKQVFQLTYQPAIIDGVQQRLGGKLATGTTAADVRSGRTASNTTVNDVIDIKWSGVGVLFEPKTKPGMLQSEVALRQNVVQDMKAATQGINQLIRIGAHLNGDTNYTQYWEQNKHLYFPDRFTAPPQSSTPVSKPAASPQRSAPSASANWWEQ